MARRKARLTLALALLALFAWCPVSLAQPADAPPGEKLAYGVRDLTVQITSSHGQNRDDIAAEGYGFVVAQQGDVVTIATADHVVRDPDGSEYGQVRVVFYSDQAHPQVATVLDLRVPPAYGDLGVLEVRKPGFRMTQPPIASLPLTQGERAWRIGKQRGWTPGNVPGVFTGTERTIWLGFDNLDTPRGSSGGPIVVEQGLVGMVTDDQSGRSLVLPINIIANFFREKGLPWRLNGSAQVSPSPQSSSPSATDVPSGFRVTEAFLRAEPSEYKGDCPTKIRFIGRISVVGGSGTVSYKILRSDNMGASAPLQTLKFDEPGSRDINTDWTIGGPGTKFSGGQTLEIVNPTPLKPDEAHFSIECTPALPASVASVKIANISCSKIGDGAFRVEMSGDVTAPPGSFLVASATPYRPGSSRSTFNMSCGPWIDLPDGPYHYCKPSEDQPSQTKWNMINELYDQGNVQPNWASAHLYKGKPDRTKSTPNPILASDYQKLVCR